MATANQMPLAEELPERTPPPSRWSLAHRVLFRFVCCYLVLFCMRSFGLLQTICPWVAVHVFGLSGERTTYFQTGSGDTTLAYIEALINLVISLVATLIWSIADRKRPDYRRLHAWLRLLVRYSLALTLFQYGFAKVVPQQFRPLPLIKYLEPYGEFSPMGVLWSFMGASMAYTVFSGAAEVLGGLLLFFRRTTTLGALVSMAVMTNVVALNFCYDVPVKLYSTHLLLMAIFLAAPDIRRLCNVLVLNRAAAPADPMAVSFERRGLRIAAWVLWTVFASFTIGAHVVGSHSAYQRLYGHRDRPSIYGVYDVETFRQFGEELPLASGGRWRRVVFDAGMMVVQTMDDRTVYYRGTFDDVHHNLLLTRSGTVTWSLTDADHLAIECNVGGVPESARLRKVDMKTFPLLSRGFHWISEYPFNK